MGLPPVSVAASSPTDTTHSNSPIDSRLASQTDSTQLNQTNQTQNSSPTSQGTVGYWGGVWHNESFQFDNNESAYLNESQIEQLTNRTIARIELLRNDTFNSRPPVNIVTRESYKKSSGGYNKKEGSFKAWNNIVWESTFIVGNDKNVENELSKLYGGQVRAFYSPSQDELYIIVPQDQTELVQFQPTSLAHELVHAYQDQKFDLESRQFRTQTQDNSLAKDSVIEGEAVFLETKYRERCNTQSWDCYTPEDGDSTTGESEINIGLQLSAYFPYSDGHAYVKHQYEEGGWKHVNQSYQTVPDSTTQIIHYTQSTNPIEVEIDDKSSTDWTTFTHGEQGEEELGESTLAIMFWYQNHEYNIDTGITNQDLMNSQDVSLYNYDYPMTAGLRGDTILPYKNYDKNTTGYVLKTEWKSEEEATEFRTAYTEILAGHDGVEHNTSLEGIVYELPNDSSYAGVYYINQTNSTITITHANSLDAVKSIRGITTTTQRVGDSTPWYKEFVNDASPFSLIVLGGCILLFFGFGIKVWLFS